MMTKRVLSLVILTALALVAAFLQFGTPKPGPKPSAEAPAPATGPQIDVSNSGTGLWTSDAPGGQSLALEIRDGRMLMAALMGREDGTAAALVASGATERAEINGSVADLKGRQTLMSDPAPEVTVEPTLTQFRLWFPGSDDLKIAWAQGPPGGGHLTLPMKRADPSGETPPAGAVLPQSGWWNNPGEPAVNNFIAVNGTSIRLVLLRYTEDGRDTWYSARGVMTFDPKGNASVQMDLVRGRDVRTLVGPLRSATSDLFGTIGVNFTGAMQAEMTLPNGRKVPIRRLETL